jgi:hypothetical protein
MPQQWDTTHAATSGIGFSNSNLTVTRNGSGDNNYSGYAKIAVTSGKYYWETTVTGHNDGAGNGPLVGIGNTASLITVGDWVGDAPDTVGYQISNASNIWNNGGVVGPAGPEVYSNGDTVCHALDMVNKTYWVRRNGDSWFNDGTANPATNTGGYTLPAAVYANPVCPAYTLYFLTGPTDGVTGAFTEGSWKFTPPAGFGAFEPTPMPVRRRRKLQKVKVNKRRRVKSAALPVVLPMPRPRRKPKKPLPPKTLKKRIRKSAPWFATPTVQPVPLPKKPKPKKLPPKPVRRRHLKVVITQAAPNTTYTPSPKKHKPLHHRPIPRKRRLVAGVLAPPLSFAIPVRPRKRRPAKRRPVLHRRHLVAGVLAQPPIPWLSSPKKRRAQKHHFKVWHRSKVAGILALPPPPTPPLPPPLPVPGLPGGLTYEQQRNALVSAYNTGQLTARQYYYALYALQWSFSGAVSWQTSFRPKSAPGDLPLQPIQPFLPNQFIGGSSDTVVDAATLVRTAEALITQGVPLRLFPAPPPPRWAFALYGTR